MTAQDEIRIKAMLDAVHLLIEGLQAQITELKQQVESLKVASPAGPLPVVSAKKAKASTTEEPTTP